MTPVENLLDRLDLVKQTGPDRYLARCPAHDDHTPSLSIRDLGETFLVKCWTGCGGVDVMEAVGLTAADFWEKPPEGTKRARPYITVKELAKVLDREAWITVMCAQKVADDDRLTDDELTRLLSARRRITKVLEVVRHG